MQKNLNFLKFQHINTISKLSQESKFTYNYLIGMAMLYMALTILSGLSVYKLVILGPFLFPAGIFTTPLTYCLSNVTTEVYGYPVGRNMMWWFVVSSTVFTCLAFLLIHLPSPLEFKHQPAFDLILGSMPRIYIAGTIGTIIGMNVNNYLVSKFKIKMEGKHYWLRSIISTSGGEIAYNFIAYPMMMLWKVPLIDLMHIFISVTIFKIFTTSIFLLPECLLANYLKVNEKINVFDFNVNYNLFKFKIHEDSHKSKLSIIK